MTAELATFVDHDTLVYERVYVHPVERVWEAVSTGSHLSTWMMPTTTVERRAGGVATFTWGGDGSPGEPFDTYDVRDFEPPNLITFAARGGPAFMRFELAAVEGAVASTRLRFTLHWPAPIEWVPEAMSTFHSTLDRLGSWLDGASPLPALSIDLAGEYRSLAAAR